MQWRIALAAARRIFLCLLIEQVDGFRIKNYVDDNSESRFDRIPQVLPGDALNHCALFEPLQMLNERSPVLEKCSFVPRDTNQKST